MNQDDFDVERIFEEGTLIDEALKAAVREAIQRHAERGETVVVYEDGKTLIIPAKELLARDPPQESP